MHAVTWNVGFDEGSFDHLIGVSSEGMPFSKEQCDEAERLQIAAAHDSSAQIRLVAGPGSGKSKVIEERICWLLGNGVNPKSIFAISFTRASAKDLRHRIEQACTENGRSAADVKVSTLHSLALKILQKAKLLTAYPVPPLVLDDWELENIFDDEFKSKYALMKSRGEEIRVYHEALWSTGEENHPSYIKPEPPVSDGEIALFNGFHPTRTRSYACVLAGEIVRKCVEQIDAGLLSPADLMGIDYLIVDEYQDLNPIDLKFIDLLASGGVKVFVAGDDDQSIYSFRYASPAGIQDFPSKYPRAGVHNLEACFRCTPAVLDAAQAVINANPGVNRIPKRFASLYSSSSPRVEGVVHRWKFTSDKAEAGAIASSCKALIESGVDAKEILILLSNRRALGKAIVDALKECGVPHELPKSESLLDTNGGRFAYSLVRIVCNPDDYVAHRTLLGTVPGVGAKTCLDICDAAITKNVNYKDIFYQTFEVNVFGTRGFKAVARAWEVCKNLEGWTKDDTLDDRRESLNKIVNTYYFDADWDAWVAATAELPDGMTISELRDYLATENEEQEASILAEVRTRLGQEAVSEATPTPRVRIMTMHGAKGLSGHVVFIPGLEDSILPGDKKRPYAGLVFEAARMLYVSVTRARAACVISMADNRLTNGAPKRQTPSMFAAHSGGAFVKRTEGLGEVEVARIVEDLTNLF